MKKYEKYKESGIQWIGKMPEHWKVCKVKHLINSLKSGGTPEAGNSTFYTENGTPWVAIGDMSTTPIVYNTQKKLSQEGIADKNLTIYPQGTILYSIYATIGKVAELGVPACINQAILAIEPKDCIGKAYFKYFLIALEKYVYSLATNSTQANLNAEKVANFDFLLPPLSEQQAIAEYLDKKTAKIDESVAVLEAQKSDLQKYRAAVITEAVTRGLDAAAKMKESGVEWIGEIPEEWKMSRLKYVLKVNGRVGFKGYTTADLVAEGEGAYTIGGKHITNCVLDLSNADYISWDKYYESPEIMVHQGDIVMAQRGTLGKMALIREDIGPATINPSLVLLNQIKLNNLYLLYYLLSHSAQECIILMNTATAVPMISQNQIENMPIPVPPLSEQQAIAEYLDKKTAKIDESIALIDAQIADLRAYRSAVISEAVTGKIDVQ